MAYRIKIGPRLEAEIRRLLLAQIDQARALLSSGEDAPIAVHESRKAMKRGRALLRLARPGLDRRVFRIEDQCMRSVGKLLSQERDRHVMHQTLQSLAAHCHDEETTGALSVALSLFHSDKPSSGGVNGPSEAVPEEQSTRALKLLDEAARRCRKLSFRPGRIETLAEGYSSTYAHARRACKVAYENGRDTEFHDFRRCVQRHWRHLQLLANVWPELMEVRIATARQLSQLLGDEHDCSILIEHMVSPKADTLSERQRALIIAFTRSEQENLRAAAHPVASRLLVQSPADLRRQLEKLWPIARRLNADRKKSSATPPTLLTKSGLGT